MQIIVYKIANNTLFIDKIEERGGEKYFLSFPEEIKGNCHIGKHIVPIKDGRCEIAFPLSRTMYPVWIEGEDCRYEGEGILYKDGRFHRVREEELSRRRLFAHVFQHIVILAFGNNPRGNFLPLFGFVGNRRHVQIPVKNQG